MGQNAKELRNLGRVQRANDAGAWRDDAGWSEVGAGTVSDQS